MTDVLQRAHEIAPATPIDPDGLAAAHALVTAWTAEPPHVVPAALHPRRRTRLAGRAALTGAAAVVLAAVALVVGPVVAGPDGTPRQAPPPLAAMFPLPAAAAGDARCLKDPMGSGGPPQPVTADVLRTPGLSAAARMLHGQQSNRLGVTVGDYPCGQAFPAAVFYASDGSGGITMYPDVADPWPGLRAPDDVEVRGQTGRTLTPEAGHHFLTWVEPDGIRWFVVANGIDVPALTTWLATVQLSGSTVPPDAVAPGMQRLADLPVHAPGPSREISWEVDYGTNESVDSDGDGYEEPTSFAIELTVTVGSADPVESALSWNIAGRQVTEVGGRLATFSSGHEGGSSLHWSDGTRTYLLMGAPSLDAALALARTVEAVPLDDPRVLALVH